MRLVVTLPTFNEKENVEEIIKKVLAQSKNISGMDLQVLVADSHSEDGTGEIVKKISKTNPKVHYLDVKARGLGVGLVKGHRFAINRLKADILAQMDADLSHDPSSLPKMVENIKQGYDLVNGSRLTKGGKNLLGLHRRIFTRGAAMVCRITWGQFKLTEFTTSYRVFTKDLFQRIDFSKVPWRAQTYIIQPAFLYAAIEAGAKIKEVPIIFEDRKKGYSKSKIYNYIIDVLFFGAKVRFEKSKTFIKFLMVGAVGYLVNAIALGLLNRGEIFGVNVLSQPILSAIPIGSQAPNIGSFHIDRLFISALISVELSIFSNFMLHDNWTFRNRFRDGSIILRFAKFNITSAASPLIQLISILFFVRSLGQHEQLGLAVGVIIGLFVNYFLNLLIVWKEHPQTGSLVRNLNPKIE